MSPAVEGIRLETREDMGSVNLNGKKAVIARI